MIDFNVAVAYQPSLQFQKREILWISTGNFFCFWNSLAADDPGKRFTGWSYRDTIKAFKTVLVKVAENCKWNSTLHAIGRNFCAYAEDQIFARFDIEVIKRKFWKDTNKMNLAPIVLTRILPLRSSFIMWVMLGLIEMHTGDRTAQFVTRVI